jgi:hypothetical protein
MKQIVAEKFVEQIEAEVYPITIIKFLLNRSRILSYFSKVVSKNFQIDKLNTEHENCLLCKQSEEKLGNGVLCRQHTSLERIMKASTVVIDLDTKVYFYKNEIFRLVDNNLVIVYCPHPRLITSPITDIKVRKVKPTTFNFPGSLPKYEQKSFLSTQLMESAMKCWFNDEFSIITIPKDNNSCDFCLVPNK